jgi:post-segregation antitoxin (ccd killing protein)
MTAVARISVPVSPGELVDKITILEIKAARIRDPAKRRNVAHELSLLVAAREAALEASQALDALAAELKAVNQRLWEIEDAIRDCERRQDFGAAFVGLARAVYRNNDRRSDLKRRINALTGSDIVEEKEYAAY